MDGGESARQSNTSCSDHEVNCTAARGTDTLALSSVPAWRDNGSVVDAYRLVELQLPATTVRNFLPYLCMQSAAKLHRKYHEFISWLWV